MPVNVIKARLNSLRKNLPKQDVEESVVQDFNGMVRQLQEELLDPEVSHFLVADTDMRKQFIFGTEQGAVYTDDRFCDSQIFKRQVEGLWEYLVDSNLIGGNDPRPRRASSSRATVDVLKRPPSHRGLSIFISHSSKDADLALALIDLLKAGLAFTADQIRCSSVDGYRLPVGVNSEGKLREEVNAAKVVIGLITRSSLSSYYVMFELGARWGADLFLAPLLAGVKANELSGPLSLLNALSANSEAQLHQLLEDIAKHLGLSVQPPASYIRNIRAVKALADALETAPPPAAVATPVKQRLRLGVSVEGEPPSQMLRVTANQTVEVTRVEYMLSSEATIDAEDVSKQGDKVEIPIRDDSVLKVWNTPRADRNHHDHSGPAKIAVTVSVDGETNQYILPVQMQAGFQGNTAVRKLVGSKTFYGGVS
jgi:hypothetical protein